MLPRNFLSRELYKSSRCLYSSFPSVKKIRPSSNLVQMPQIVQEKLKGLKIDVVKSVLDDTTVASSSFTKSLSSDTDFTKILRKMAEYYFSQSGKLLRPKISLLMAHGCNQLKRKYAAGGDGTAEEISLNQYRIALISEMIHTASLVHDDVIDESTVRRGNPTVNALWGNKMAVLVGDYILARATQILCSIGRPNVISVMALIIEDLVKGEFMQMMCGDEIEQERTTSKRFEDYMAKTYSKTASLFANSCKSVAMLADLPESDESIAYEYGRSFGIAFQLVDDMLDFVSDSTVMGKPTANDLKLGLATAPVLYAAEEFTELEALIDRRFSGDGDVEKAWELVLNSSGLEKTRSLAKQYAENAAKTVAKLPNGDGVRDCLIELAMLQLERRK